MAHPQLENANPVLAEFVRGNMVENRHRGAFCVVDEKGKVLLSGGNIDAAIYPRSAIKSLQALALFKSGAVEKFSLDDRDLALACASHLGEDFHVEGVARFLDKIGMGEGDLECGAHPPSGRAARKALLKNGNSPSTLHNNCSGKHAGMLAVAKALGVEPAGYIEKDHPAQILVRECVESVLEVPLTLDQCGRDGCSIPTWGAPLFNFAHAFAKLSAGSDALTAEEAIAGQKLFSAATAHPELIAGTDGFDTNAMKIFGGELMVKIGAAGVFCGALRGKNIGFALKCDDGNLQAAEVMVAALLTRIADPDNAQQQVLEKHMNLVVKNWRGFEVGSTKSCQAWSQFALRS